MSSSRASIQTTARAAISQPVVKVATAERRQAQVERRQEHIQVPVAASRPLRALIIDHKLFADAIAPVLQLKGIEVLEIATNGEDALRIFREHRPDLVLMELKLPDANLLDVGQAMIEEQPEVKVLAVTALSHPQVVREAMQKGFAGFLTKDNRMAEFVASIDSALAGNVVISRRVARSAVGTRSPAEENAHLLANQLTVREREVLVLLAQGLGSAYIARELSIRANTLRTHVQNILMKLQVHSRLEAVAFATKFGLVTAHE
jgi:two-component system nitrate/nitrite response regulator NarL